MLPSLIQFSQYCYFAVAGAEQVGHYLRQYRPPASAEAVPQKSVAAEPPTQDARWSQ